MGALEQQVRDLAVERFGSLAAFSRASGVNYQTLSSMLERGSLATARLATASDVADALGADLGELAHGRLAAAPVRGSAAPAPGCGPGAPGAARCTPGGGPPGELR